MRKRSSFDIILQILELLNEKESCKKTEIVYDINLNFKTAERYLKCLEKKGLIKLERYNNVKLYSITNRGRELYERIKELREIINEILY